MDFKGILWVLGGAVLFAIMNVLKAKAVKPLEKKGYGLDAVVVTAVTTLAASVISFAAGLIVVGLPQIKVSSDITSGFLQAFAVTAVINIFIQYGNTKAMQYGDASLVVPVASTMPMFAIVMAFAVLQEWPTFWGRIGIALVAIGSYVLNLQGPKQTLPKWMQQLLPEPWQPQINYYLNPWLRLFSNRGVQIALGVAYAGAISSTFDKVATLASDPFFFSGSVYGFVFLTLALPKALNGEWKGLITRAPYLLLTGAFHGLANCMYGFGYYYGLVPYVGALKRTQIFWTVLFAGTILKEEHMRGRLVGATILYVGVTLLAF